MTGITHINVATSQPYGAAPPDPACDATARFMAARMPFHPCSIQSRCSAVSHSRSMDRDRVICTCVGNGVVL